MGMICKHFVNKLGAEFFRSQCVFLTLMIQDFIPRLLPRKAYRDNRSS